MKTYRPFVLPGSLVACLFAVSSLSAQVAPTTSAGPNEEEKSDTIVLSPFVVTDEQDSGYVATSTLAGSRLNTLLKDTPAAISVLTSEFLADIGAQNLEEAIEWSTNTSFDGQQGIALASSTSNDNATFYSFGDVKVRGLPATRTRNYFGFRLPSDTYNVDRIEEARGPNSILFGLGSAGGVLNTQTKRAVVGREIRRGSFQVGSYESYRATIDLNQPIGDKLALRLNAVYTDNGSYREYAGNENQMVHLAGTWQATSKTRVRAEYETGIVDQIVASNDPVTDQYTNWTTRGNQLITTPIPTNQNSAFGVSRYAATNAIAYISNTNTAYRISNTYLSGGSDNLVPYIDPSMGDYSVNTGGWGAVRRGDFETYAVFLEQELWKNTYLELGYNHQENNSKAYMPAGNSRRLYADPNATLPNGQPNPNAGRFYLEGQTWTWNVGRGSDTLRASLASEADFGKWGNYRFAAMVEREKRDVLDSDDVEVWEGAPYHASPENAANQVIRRHYVTPGDWSSYYRSTPKSHGLISGVTDPITGRTLSSTMVPRRAGIVNAPEEQDAKMVSLQARYFDGRLILGAGHRWDDLSITNYGSLRNPTTQLFETDFSTFTSQAYEGRTRTYGVMAHLTQNISAFYNNSNNFGLPGNARILPDSLRAGNPTATGEDIGLLFNFLDNRVSVRASYYKTDLANGSGSAYGGTLTNPSSIANIMLDALISNGVLTESQASSHRSQSTGSTFNRLVEGYEFNVTANPTRNWRLQANFSITDGYVSNIAPEVKEWIAREIPFYQSFDQNILTNQAALTIGGVISEFFEYHDSQLAGEGVLLPGNRKYKGNFYTSYSFNEGRLKGLTVGGGYNWQSKLPVGMNGDDIRYSNDVWNTNAMIRYRFNNVPFLKRLDLQLNVTNITDDDEMEIIRYAGNNPDFPTYDILRRIRVKSPRSFRLTANYEF